MKQAFLFIIFIVFNSVSYADNDGEGQLIQIQTRIHSFLSKPSWLLEIRDLDHGQTIPYVFDFTAGTQVWTALTFSRHYLIIASSLQFSPYTRHPYCSRRVENFCSLESHGRIIRGKSISITITGKLSPYPETYTCRVAMYDDPNFTTTPQVID